MYVIPLLFVLCLLQVLLISAQDKALVRPLGC